MDNARILIDDVESCIIHYWVDGRVCTIKGAKNNDHVLAILEEIEYINDFKASCVITPETFEGNYL